MAAVLVLDKDSRCTGVPLGGLLHELEVRVPPMSVHTCVWFEACLKVNKDRTRWLLNGRHILAALLASNLCRIQATGAGAQRFQLPRNPAGASHRHVLAV